MSGTHRDLLFWSKGRCFAWKNHRWGLWSLETWYSGPKVALLNAQNHKWGLEPTYTCHSGANHAVLHTQNDRWGVGPIETCNSGPKFTVLLAKTTDEGWNQWRLLILILTVCLAQAWKDYMGSNLHLWCCACKTATLGLELQVSVGPSPYLWFVHSKERH